MNARVKLVHLKSILAFRFFELFLKIGIFDLKLLIPILKEACEAIIRLGCCDRLPL